MTANDLLFVLEDGTLDLWTSNHQPTTEHIYALATQQDKCVIQLIGGRHHVYDLATLRMSPMATIGVPVFVTDDFDAAVMYATLYQRKK